jgi:hypothetical protein
VLRGVRLRKLPFDTSFEAIGGEFPGGIFAAIICPESEQFLATHFLNLLVKWMKNPKTFTFTVEKIYPSLLRKIVNKCDKI